MHPGRQAEGFVPGIWSLVISACFSVQFAALDSFSGNLEVEDEAQQVSPKKIEVGGQVWAATAACKAHTVSPVDGFLGSADQ